MPAKRMRIDIWSGMFLSNLSFFFIVAACGGVLQHAGYYQHNIGRTGSGGTAAFAGEATYLLFTIGIVGVGLLAIPVLAGRPATPLLSRSNGRVGAPAAASSLRILWGNYYFYAGWLGLNFIGLDPIKALIYSAVGNGLVAPIVLFFMAKMGSSKAIMGRWRNRTIPTIIGWVTFAVMLVSGVAAIWALLTA